MESQIFNVIEKYYCKWTQGAKEYFNSREEAVNYAKKQFERTQNMTDDDFAYWQRQEYVIGKELVITQDICLISKNSF